MLLQLKYGTRIRVRLWALASLFYLLDLRLWARGQQGSYLLLHHWETHSTHREMLSKCPANLTGQRGVWSKACTLAS